MKGTQSMLEQTMDVGVRRAVKAAGSVRSLARLIGISHVSVYRWKEIPVRRLLLVEEKTGIDRELLRPDLAELFSVPRSSKKQRLTGKRK